MSVLKWLNFTCASLYRLQPKVIAPYPCFMFGKVFITSIKDIFQQPHLVEICAYKTTITAYMA